MPAIADRVLARRYKEIENSQTTIDTKNVLPLLAAIGDMTSRGADYTLKMLAKAPTKQAQFDIVKEGLTDGEFADVESILDSGTAPMSAEWKNFFEALVERAVLDTETQGNAPLQVNESFKGGISGTAPAGVVVEAINLTTAPSGRLHLDDTVDVATADANGKFKGDLKGQLQGTLQGDVIMLRTRDKDGKTSEWTTVRAGGLAAADTRNAVPALFRIGLTPDDQGNIAVANINASRPICEPGAVLQFKNQRTGETFKVTINGEGQMPAGVTIKGKPGDTITVAATDGTNNKNFAKKTGELTVPKVGTNPGHDVDLKDPALHKDELDGNGKPRFQTARFTGPLFVREVSYADVAQGQIGDCYFPSALAGIAHFRPEAIKKAIKDNGDGTYTVTFLEKNWRTGKYDPIERTIDGDLYVRSSGSPLYGATTGANTTSNMELWFPLIEKAYADWQGSYDAIGNGGSAGGVMEVMLGEETTSMFLGTSATERAWTLIKESVDAKNPSSLGTSDDEAKYKGTGIYGDHSYSVLGYKEVNGKRYVQIRNPWGESEPSGNGENDGVFFMEVEEVCRLFVSLDAVV
jgi:Calpain family cysteine protease